MATLSLPVYQVFINFRGKDLRYGFASHLIDALERHNIKFFIDTHEQKGRDLKHLFKRIEQARVGLVILSARYAESKWCLEELTRIMEQVEKGGMIVIPIFYKVRPEDVRKQRGEFGCKFRRQTGNSSREEMEKWQVALKAVCNKIGFTLDYNRSEAKLIKKVVQEVGNVLTAILSDEGREEDSVKNIKKVKTYYILGSALPWLLFGSAMLLGFGLLADTVHKCSSPAMVSLVGQVGSVVKQE